MNTQYLKGQLFDRLDQLVSLKLSQVILLKTTKKKKVLYFKNLTFSVCHYKTTNRPIIHRSANASISLLIT